MRQSLSIQSSTDVNEMKKHADRHFYSSTNSWPGRTPAVRFIFLSSWEIPPQSKRPRLRPLLEMATSGKFPPLICLDSVYDPAIYLDIHRERDFQSNPQNELISELSERQVRFAIFGSIQRIQILTGSLAPREI